MASGEGFRGRNQRDARDQDRDRDRQDDVVAFEGDPGA